MAPAGTLSVRLVTGPIQTGKTTRLRAWVDSKNRETGRMGGRAPAIDGVPAVDGVLAPVIGGERHLLHAASGETRNLEQIASDDPVVAVRRFRFNGSVFAWARSLIGAVSEQTEWIVIDEIGPLELRGGGLEPAVGELFARFRLDAGRERTPGIVLVVRDTLVERALSHFGLAEDQALPFDFP